MEIAMVPLYLLPVSPGLPPRQRPVEVLDALVAQLRQGTTGGSLYICADRMLGVLSLPGVSVWTNGRVLWWRTRTMRPFGRPQTRLERPGG